MRQSNLCSIRSNMFSQSFSPRADASSRLLSNYNVVDIMCASLIFHFEFVHYSILHMCSCVVSGCFVYVRIPVMVLYCLGCERVNPK